MLRNPSKERGMTGKVVLSELYRLSDFDSSPRILTFWGLRNSEIDLVPLCCGVGINSM